MRELPDPEHLLRPRDRAPLIYVSAQTYHCVLCDPDDTSSVLTTTVVWLGVNTEGPHGRCTICGQLYVLSRAGEHVPAPQDQHPPH